MAIVSSRQAAEGVPIGGELSAQLAPRVVQRLVQSAARGAEALGENVDRHAVDGKRNQHPALVGRQGLVRSRPGSPQQLGLLRLLVGPQADAREEIPSLLLDRHLASLPGAPAQLHGCFEQCELVGPRREPAAALEVVEAREHAHQGVIRRLERDVVELAAAQVRKRALPAVDLESSGAQQQRVQPGNRLVAAARALVAKTGKPRLRLAIQSAPALPALR